MIVLGAVEELTEGGVHAAVVLRVLDVEVSDPTELTVDVSFLRKFCVVWHTRALYIILFIRIKLALRVQQDSLLVLEIFIEVLLRRTNKFKYVEALIDYF